MTFKVGDIVTIKNTANYYHLKQGTKYTVSEVSWGTSGQLIKVSEFPSQTYKASNFNLVKTSDMLLNLNNLANSFVAPIVTATQEKKEKPRKNRYALFFDNGLFVKHFDEFLDLQYYADKYPHNKYIWYEISGETIPPKDHVKYNFYK